MPAAACFRIFFYCLLFDESLILLVFNKAGYLLFSSNSFEQKYINNWESLVFMGGKRLSIAVDCDEPLADMNTYLQQWHNWVYRKGMRPLSRDDVFTFNLGVVWGVSREESNRRVLEFYRSDAFDRMTPTKGSVESIEILAKDHDALVLTSRIDAAVPKTCLSLTCIILENSVKSFFQAIILWILAAARQKQTSALKGVLIF